MMKSNPFSVFALVAVLAAAILSVPEAFACDEQKDGHDGYHGTKPKDEPKDEPCDDKDEPKDEPCDDKEIVYVDREVPVEVIKEVIVEKVVYEDKDDDDDDRDKKKKKKKQVKGIQTLPTTGLPIAGVAGIALAGAGAYAASRRMRQ